MAPISPTRAWISTLRIKTLPAAAVPVLVGSGHAWHLADDGYLTFHWPAAIAVLITALLIQIGTNLANDYFDHRKGADTPERAGPQRASASGLLPPHHVRNAAYATFTLAALGGLYISLVAGWPILAIGIAGILSGILYTAGPRPLGYIGLGDLFVFLFFGPIAVMGTTYVQGYAVFWEPAVWMPALFLGIALGCLATAILVVNNLRDRPTDETAGKRTLAVRFGDRWSRIEYITLVAIAFILTAMSFSRHREWRLLLPILSLPLAIPPTRRVLGDLKDRTQLNPALGGTARLLLVYGLLTTLGLLL